MEYCFADLSLQINGCKVKPYPFFDAFRLDNKTESLLHRIAIEVIPVARIPRLDAPVIAADLYGADILICEGTEYRRYRHILTGDLFALLKEEGCEKETYGSERSFDDQISHERVLFKKTLYVKESFISGEGISEILLFNCLGIEKTLGMLNRFLLHSSHVQTDKGSILFTAPSQTGKSTQAELWRLYRDAFVVNGDRALLYIRNGCFHSAGIPWCGTSGISHNKIIPLRAIVSLRQGSINQVRRISVMESIRVLMAQFTVNPWNLTMRDQVLEFIYSLLDEIPVLELSCRPDSEAVDVLEEALKRMEGSHES